MTNVLLGLTVLGCVNLPARELDLSIGSWHVVSIGETRIDAGERPRIEFRQPDVDHAVLTTGCRTVVVAFILDSDSEAIGFEQASSAADCPPPNSVIDEALVLALANVERWAILDANSVELRGHEAIRLERSPPSDSDP